MAKTSNISETQKAQIMELASKYGADISIKEIAQRVGTNYCTVVYWIRKNKIQKAHKRHKQIPYKHINYVKQNYPQKTAKQITEELGIKATTVRNIIQKLITEGKVQRRPKWTPPKGGKPFYINTKPNRTSFQKGHIPQNFCEIGSERKPNAEGIIMVKVAHPNTWISKQAYLYQTHIGAIPEGHIVVFKDHNKQNFSLDNLIAISRRENLLRNANREKAAQTQRKNMRKAAAGFNVKDKRTMRAKAYQQNVKAIPKTSYLDDTDFQFA